MALKTLLSLTVFILLGLYVYFFELRDKDRDLLEFIPEDVEELVLTYWDRRIELSRDDSGEWSLTQPIEVSADASTVEGIIKTLRQTKIKRILEEDPSESDMNNFGLKRPWVSLAMVTRSGRILPPILVGKMAPLGDQVYVKRGDYSAVFLTDAGLRTSLDKRLTDFRDKRILRFNRWNVARLEIRKDKERLVLVRDKGGSWEMETPRKAKVKRKTVNDYLATLLQLRAEDFSANEPVDLKQYRLDNPSLVISFEGDSSKHLETLLISENEKFFAKRVGHPTVYTIDPISFIQIHKTVNDFLAG